MNTCKTAVVTGGSGFIGRHLVSYLLGNDYEVVVLDKEPYLEWTNPKFRFVHCDVAYWGDVNKIADRIPSNSVVFHLAAQSRVNPSLYAPLRSYQDNIMGTANVLDLLCKPKGNRLVYAGSSSYYGGVMANPYAFSKHVGEQMCQMYTSCHGVETAIARFFNVYGPGHVTEGNDATVVGIFESCYRKKQPLPITGDGEQRRDFIHVDDVVHALYLISQVEKPNAQIYDVGVGINYTINELAAMFKGAEVEYIPARAGEARNTLCRGPNFWATGRLGWFPTHELEDYVDSFCAGVNDPE